LGLQARRARHKQNWFPVPEVGFCFSLGGGTVVGCFRQVCKIFLPPCRTLGYRFWPRWPVLFLEFCFGRGASVGTVFHVPTFPQTRFGCQNLVAPGTGVGGGRRGLALGRIFTFFVVFQGKGVLANLGQAHFWWGRFLLRETYEAGQKTPALPVFPRHLGPKLAPPGPRRPWAAFSPRLLAPGGTWGPAPGGQGVFPLEGHGKPIGEKAWSGNGYGQPENPDERGPGAWSPI